MYDSSYDSIREKIREDYKKVLTLKEFGFQNPCTCANSDTDVLGYTSEDYAKVPKESNLLLGCANPSAYVKYNKGDTVLDLGCGAGFDCFLAADKVGEKGKVIGVDMMYEMLSKARKSAHTHKYKNVEFRLGEIEHLPVADKSIDIIISNCVLNLSPDKKQVIKECKRVMKENARLFLFDILLDKSFNSSNKEAIAHIKSASCILNALKIDEMHTLLEEAGFKDISITLHKKSDDIINSWIKDTSIDLENKVYSAIIEARL